MFRACTGWNFKQSQFYKLSEVLPLIKHPVIYNGDIKTMADKQQIKETYPKVADIMVGRGILYNPTLAIESGNCEVLKSGKEHLTKHFIGRLMEEIRRTALTEESALRKTKEYWCLLWRALPISEAEARKVLREQELTTVDKMICTFIQ